MNSKYLLNKRSGVLHTYPAFEACNTDDITDTNKQVTIEPLRDRPRFRIDCKRCFADPPLHTAT